MNEPDFGGNKTGNKGQTKGGGSFMNKESLADPNLVRSQIAYEITPTSPELVLTLLYFLFVGMGGSTFGRFRLDGVQHIQNSHQAED